MGLAERYQQLKDTSNPSLLDRFQSIEAHLETLVTQNSALGETLKTLAKVLADPVRISTWGSTALTLVDTNEHRISNPRQIVAFSAWIEGSPAAAPGISLVFDQTLVTPNFQQVVSGPIAYPTTVALLTMPATPVHVILLTSAFSGWMVW